MAVAPRALAVHDVIDAMRSIQSESDRWHLADALARQIPNGTKEGSVSFATIIDEATKEGVVGKLNATTLRLYRDSANRWPSDKRLPGVSFSAHRAAESLQGGVDQQAKMLEDLVKKEGGAAKVTVAVVRRRIRAAQGGTVPTPAASTSKRAIEVLGDLMKGAPELIGAIGVNTASDELDKLHAGLTKAIAHVERLRAKAAQRATKAKAANGPAPTPITSAKKAATPQRGGAGDLRGL